MVYTRMSLWILLLAVTSVNGMDDQQPFDAIINLGGDCQVAYQLYIHGLRKYALPFDSLITSYVALRKMLENKFAGFVARDNFELVTNEKQEKYILDKTYETRLLHDFKLEGDFLKDYTEIAAKYTRRIERFLSVVVASVYPLFIRKRISREQAVELNGVLSTLRDGKPFLLVALDGTDEIRENWQIAGIRNYYLRQPEPYIWKGDSGAWKEIFHALVLKTSDATESTDEH